MAIRHLRLIGVLSPFLLTLSVIVLFYLDVDLPTEFTAFKIATLGKLKSISGTATANDPSFHILPIGGAIVHEDGETDEFALDDVFEIAPPPHEIDSYPSSSSQHESDDSSHAYPSSSMKLTSSFETTVPNGAIIQGFSVFDNLVLHNGTFYVVTKDRSAFPEKTEDIFWIRDTSDKTVRETYSKDVQFIAPHELTSLLGDSAIRMQGTSWILYDIPQFMKHYYHWWGEIIIGGWRTYSLVGFDSSGTFHPDQLQSPARFLLPLVTNGEWRDSARVVGPLMRAAFPHAAIEENDQWRDFMKLNSTIVFDRALVINREAAHRHRYGSRWFKMIAGTQELPAAKFDPTPSPSHEGFWSPVRKSLTRNLLGYLPQFTSLTDRTVLWPPKDKSEKPVVTYIDRQGTGRRLIDESHQSLVDALRGLEEEGICELQHVRMENVDLREQIRLVARSAIIVGVHGNGLTHQLWMPPSARSAIFEIVYPGGYDFDYEMLARNMGHKHYIVWNDTFITYPEGTYHETVKIPPEFHSAKIYVHGPAVAQKIKERLQGTEGDSDTNRRT